MRKLRFEETTPEQFDAILDLNLRAAFFCTQGAADALRSVRGRVVNVADLAGLEPWVGYVAHSISKAGVVMLTKVLARCRSRPTSMSTGSRPAPYSCRTTTMRPSGSGSPGPRRSAAWDGRTT